MFAGGDICPSCGARNHHIATEDVDDGHQDRPQGPLPGESALSDAIDGISGIEIVAPESPSINTNLPFQVGGVQVHSPSLPFGIGAPTRVARDTDGDGQAVTPESLPTFAEKTPVHIEPEISIVQEKPEVEQLLPDTKLLPDTIQESEALTVFEEESLSENPVLVEDAYQIKVSEFDALQVYAVEEDVVIHDFGDELQVSEVIVNFDDLVDPAEQTVHFDPELLVEGEPELLPARALPIDDGGNEAVVNAVADGFQALGDGRWADAADRFREVCNLKPGDPASLNDYGLSLLQLAIVIHESNPTSTPAEEPHFESAVLTLRQAAQQDKHDPTIMYNLATGLASCGRHGVATRIWDAAIALAPTDSAPLNGKAVSLIALGEFDSATSLLEHANQISPTEDTILRNLRRLRPTA
jgi:tetratricopeptide (TPR) repeat protein